MTDTSSSTRFVLPIAALTIAATACTVTIDRDDADFNAQAAVDAWVAMWNSYDLDLVHELFLTDSNVTYLSSEREGAITGIDAVREHHVGFGFVGGGETPDATLWVEDVEVSRPGEIAVVTATWYFRRGADATAELQRGPVTFVYVPTENGYRIAHAHFADY
jgi:ketosteroid isomerase-like protein